MSHMNAPRGSRRYVYRSPWKRLAAALFDFAGLLIVRVLTLGRGWTAKLPAPEAPVKILVVRLDHIGDVLFTRPLLQVLRRCRPEAHITLLVSTVNAALLAREPEIDEIIAWDAPWFMRGGNRDKGAGYQAMIARLKAGHYDLSLDLRGDLRHHVMLFRAGVKVRAGYGITGGGFLLHVPLRLRQATHEVERNLDVLRVWHSFETPERYAPLALTGPELDAGKRRWQQSQQPRVVVHPAAGDPDKCWAVEKYAHVCGTLLQKGCEVILVGAVQEQDRLSRVEALCSQPLQNLAGRTSIRELAALITAADLFIGNDSGPGHLAVTQQVPVIMLWSETNAPEEWGPWGKDIEARVIRRPQRPEAAGEVIAAAQAYLRLPA